MKKRILALAGACMLLALAAGCGGAGELKAGAVCRRPAADADSTAAWQAARGLEEALTPDETGEVDLRSADLRQADMAVLAPLLLRASFDEHTQWPAGLPEDFDPAALMELGKDPGLGVRDLHARGVTGKGVGIAIIDQTLLVDHREYADRVRLYQEYHTMAGDKPAMHGAAVASIALGETVGVAPEALLYYIADDTGTMDADGEYTWDLRYYAEDIDRLTALNETLPEGEKIRVISMSVGCVADTPGAAEMDAAIARARAAGIAVVWVNSHDPLMGNYIGMGRTPYGDPNDLSSARPGIFWEDSLYTGEFRGTGGSLLLVPMDGRTTAAQTGTDEYAHYSGAGSSWAVPYVAGLYALACQVKPEVTFEDFTAAARATAHPVSVTHEGKEVPYGAVLDPAALLEALGEFSKPTKR